MLDAGAHRLEMINMNISSLAEGEGNGILEEDIILECLPTSKSVDLVES